MKRILSVIWALLAISYFAIAENTVRDTLGLKSGSATNVAELIRGEVSGVRVSLIDGNPVGLMNVNIRGVNSLRFDNQPLWIVDGVMVSTSLNDNLSAFWQCGEQSYTSPLNPLAFLNAKDIEHIEVLKDISATTLYGSKGANGVIIITTKQSSRRDLSISISSDVGINTCATKISNENLGCTVDQNHSVNISGVLKNTGYCFAGAIHQISGVLPNNSSLYGTLKANINTQANKTIWFGFNTYLSFGKSSSPTGVAYIGHPSMTLVLRDASLFGPTTYSQWASDYDDNTKDFRGLLSAYLRINILKNLYFKASAGLDFQRNSRILWYGTSTELGAISSSNQYGGASSTINSILASYNARFEVNYFRSFAVNHNFKADVNAEILGDYSDFNTMNGFNFVSHDLRGRGLMLGAFEIRNHVSVRNTFHYGVYAHVGYDYKKIVGADIVARIDDTPKYLGKYFAFYPSVNAFFDIHKAFLADYMPVSTIKLSGGYGVSGKEKQVPFDLIGNYLTSSWPVPEDGAEPFFDGVGTLKTSEWHVSLNAGFLRDRLKLEINYFDKNTDDVFDIVKLGNPSEDPKYIDWTWGGCENVLSRKTSISNKGIEASISATSDPTQKFHWGIGANVSFIVNRVTSSDKEDFHGKKVGNDFVCTCNGVNVPVSTLFGYTIDKDNQLIDRTMDGRLDDADMIVLGNTIPVISGGLDFTIGYGGFSFLIAADGSAGQKVANMNYLAAKGLRDPSGAYVLTDPFVENADFLRIGTLGITYSIPFQKVLKSLDFRFQCKNAFVLTNYSGWNPDVNCFGVSPISSGIDYGSYPMARSFIFGISAKF